MNAKAGLARTKKFVADHKVAIAVTVTAAATTAVMMRAHRATIQSLNEFLAERGLTEEFYSPEN